MNKKRLQKLADHLRTVPVSKLDMRQWACGTTACAMGHACEIPSFKRAGLKLGPTGFFDRDGVSELAPVFDGDFGYAAAGAFFDISEFAAFQLFSSLSYDGKPRPTTVAKRIEAVIAKA
jgi:hypothetical protein